MCMGVESSEKSRFLRTFYAHAHLSYGLDPVSLYTLSQAQYLSPMVLMVRIANVLINAIFKHACAATEYSQKPKNWHEQSSTSIN